jgi:ligand-binding SRPBCC domain-containing protein
VPERAWTLERAQLVRRPRADVFAFFADPRNLERITPPFLGFRILTPPPLVMRAGLLIDYRISLHGLPLRWRTRIDAYDPPYAFTDVQLAGPYRRWVHRHEFVEVPEGTEVRDHVDYAMPFGPLGALARRIFVRAQLEAIFDFRHAAIAKELAP